MAVVALLVWAFTVAVGVYLLVTSTRVTSSTPAAPAAPSAVPGPGAGPEPQAVIPGLRAFAEFIHPALAITGIGVFFGYVLSRAWILAAVALGIGIGTVAAGLSWAALNARAARRAQRGTPDRYAMSFTPRVLLLHAAGAAVTVLLAILIVAHV